MDSVQVKETFRGFSQKLNYMRALGALLGWDDWMGLPEMGVAFRDETRAYLENERLNLVKSSEYSAVLSQMEDISADLDAVETAMLREAKREKKSAECLPQEQLVEYEALKATAQRVWQEAHHADDYSRFKPYLKEIIDFNRALSKGLDTKGHILDPLMDILDPGATVAKTDQVFAELKSGLKNLLAQINASQVKVQDDCLTFAFEEPLVARFCQELVEKLGYEPQAGGYAKTLHPFTSSLGPKDARITTNYKTFSAGLFALIHEAGHGMYAQGGSDTLDNTLLWGGLNGAFHESQSRLYENIICRSMDFWSYYYPLLQDAIPHFKAFSLAQFYGAINAVKPSLIRVNADEVTYSLHVILRYELEKQLLEGSLSVDDLPAAWNQAYEDLLGIRPETDRDGVLQDVHWSCGYFGYFQSYALGNMYSAQIFEAMLKQIPIVKNDICNGDYTTARKWLRDTVHQYSCLYTPDELIVKVTGKELTAEPYLNYLREKYLKLYC